MDSKSFYRIPIADLIGAEVGVSVVVAPSWVTAWGNIIYLCRCKCGKTFEHKDSSIRGAIAGKRSINCGCGARSDLRRGVPRNEPTWKKSMRHRYRGYKRASEARGYEWDLTLEEFYALSQENCHYCGAAPSQHHQVHAFEPFVYNGIDRRDNDKGYTPDNALPCCGACNVAKGARSYEEFIEWVARAARHLGL